MGLLLLNNALKTMYKQAKYTEGKCTCNMLLRTYQSVAMHLVLACASKGSILGASRQNFYTVYTTLVAFLSVDALMLSEA